jgi:3-phenylpropionate/trans-cinnamate dioxygenase ferredoxin reductase component
MNHVDLLIVGSGAAGVSAAVAYRDAGGGDVLVVSADPDPPYERPPLSKDFLRGEAEESDVLMHDAGFYHGREVGLRLDSSVTRLHPDRKTATLANGDEISFDACVIATGAEPRRLPVPGADDPAVLQLRSLGEGRVLRAAATRSASAVVIGSGFIGCEAAASLARRGLSVTLVTDEQAPQRNRLGPLVAQRIAGWLESEGVRLRPGTQVTGIEGARQVRVGEGDDISADLVVMAAGVRPRVELAESTGLRTDAGRIRVDARMRTSAPNVFAAGDVAYAMNEAAGRRLTVEHWGDALAMGEVAGRNAAGVRAAWAQVPGFWTTIGDHTAKYHAWGDGYDEVRLDEHDAESFTAWYGREGRVVGVLTVDADADYERGAELVERGATFAAARR